MFSFWAIPKLLEGKPVGFSIEKELNSNVKL